MNARLNLASPALTEQLKGFRRDAANDPLPLADLLSAVGGYMKENGGVFDMGDWSIFYDTWDVPTATPEGEAGNEVTEESGFVLMCERVKVGTYATFTEALADWFKESHK